MGFMSALRLPALALAIVLGLAGAGPAQDAPAVGQEPPPMPDPGTTSQRNCIDQNNEYRTSGKRHFYVQTFENKCDVRMRCAIFTYQINAKGPSQGRATLTLAAKSGGAAAKKSYAIKVKGVGGMSNSARECRAL